jgi:hypothetical protein
MQGLDDDDDKDDDACGSKSYLEKTATLKADLIVVAVIPS